MVNCFFFVVVVVFFFCGGGGGGEAVEAKGSDKKGEGVLVGNLDLLWEQPKPSMILSAKTYHSFQAKWIDGQSVWLVLQC